LIQALTNKQCDKPNLLDL